jgi:hypothetical protein
MMRALCLSLLLVFAGCVRDAVALDVDFDADLIQVQQFLGTSFTLRNVDGDGNGLKEDDQLGMLGILLGGGTPAACIPGDRLTEIQNAYTFNFTEVANNVTVTIDGVGTVNLLDQLQDVNPALGDSLRRLIAGIITLSDTETVAYVNSLADQVVAKVLDGTPQEDQTAEVQGQITFLASAFLPLGNAGGNNILGAAGDIEEDANTNLAEYDALGDKTRENWLESCCLVPTLRIVNFSGGGTKVSGLQLSFNTSAAGEAGPVTFAWFKGAPGSGTQVGPEATYTIPFANVADSGQYYAVISDGTYTRTTPAVSLSVTFVPLFITQNITGGTRLEGTSKTFTVGVQGGSPGPYVYTWKKGATVVGPNANTFVLNSLTAADTGQYSVTVSSKVDASDAVTSGPVTLTVNSVATLTIATQPTSVSKAIGESHTFSILAVGGSGTYTYNWRKNGTSLGAPSQNTLVLNNITGANAGVYSCVVTDTVENTTATTQNATLTVTGGLNITSQPQGATINVGDDYTLTVAVSGGSGNFEYQWLKDGEPVDTPSATSYTILDADGGDTGDYTCFISDLENPIISALTNTATVVVSLGGLSITEQPQGGTRFVGENVQLSVAVTGGSGLYSYDWRKGNVSLGAPNQSVLSLDNVTVENSGNYRCRITDTAQANVNILSNIATITVIDGLPVGIAEQPVGGLLYSGEPFTFSVVATGGSGSYDYAWTRDGEPVCGCNSASFTIDALSFSDSGDYQVTITDQQYPDLTAVSDVASLDVGEDISFTFQPTGGSFIAGESLVLNCGVTGGIGGLYYSWELNGQPVPNGPNTPELDLGVLRLAEAGEYVCVVSDFVRQVRSSTAVVEVALVEVPQGTYAYNVPLSGANTVPPVETIATGRAIGSLTPNSADPADGSTLQYSTVQTVGDAQTLYVFAGAPGVNGEPMINLGPALVSQAGSIQLTEEETSIIFAGYAYWAVTSSSYLDGEIRGHLVLDIEPPTENHNADQDNDSAISLSELLRVIQFYNSFALHCDVDGEDGYAPGTGDESCANHASDYAPADWKISLSELLRLIQFYNSLGFYVCEGSEDGFCPGFE